MTNLFLASEFSVSAHKITQLLQVEPLIGRKAIFIDTAAKAEGFEPDYDGNIKPLVDIGLEVVMYDLAGQSEEQVRQLLTDSAVISVSGGNSFCLLEHMKKCNFGLLLCELMGKGCIYIGSSAGSIVCSPDIDYIAPMDEKAKATLPDTKGLGLIDFAFLPHMDSPYQKEAAWKIFGGYKGPPSLMALRDDQVLRVQGPCISLL